MPRRLIVVPVVVSVLACGGLFKTPARVVALTANVDECGKWHATIRAKGSGDTLVLEVDGNAVEQWQIDGEQTVTASGSMPVGGFTMLDAEIGDSWNSKSVMLEGVAPRAAILIDPPTPQLHQGMPAVLTVEARSPCELEQDLTYALVVEPRYKRYEGRVRVGEKSQVALEAMEQGSYTMTAELSADYTVLDTRAIPLTVGPRCGDVDGDGFTNCAGDCDDLDANVNPSVGNDRVGDGKDNDCDGVNGQDRDRDGFEDAAVGGTDCDDTRPAVHPGASEGVDADGDGFFAGNAIDDDCDGQVDEGLDRPDCDDTRAQVNPSAAEASQPNGRDDNCDGRIDEGTVAFDDDGDGFSEQEGDCNDEDATVAPGAAELPDCRDDNCDGVVDEGVTLPERDDRFEPNDSRDKAWDLSTYDDRSFTRDLELVARPGDAEWFKFFSHDGGWDEWGIFATAKTLPVDATVELSVHDSGGKQLGVVRARSDGELVRVRGKAFRTDTGLYYLKVTPTEVKPWCPMTITLRSN